MKPYKDQVNLYAYVGNDPINGSDPTGLYSCGKNMSSAQCSDFKAAQAVTIQKVSGAIASFKHLQVALKSGQALSGADKATAAALNKYAGGIGGNAAAIGKVIQNATNVLGGLQGNAPASVIPGNVSHPIVGGMGYGIQLSQAAMSGSQKNLAFTIGHEAVHDRIRGSLDSGAYGYNGAYYGAYGQGAAIGRSMYNYSGKPDPASRTFESADSSAYTLGLRRDGDEP